jgi:HPt (histidine-containing phosphotransfer) domain-containing protein
MAFADNQIDREYLSEISGGDADFEQDLIQTFLEAAPGLIESFRLAAESNDPVRARHAAHTLKGSSRSIGATTFATVCEEGEKAAREDDMSACRVLSQSIQDAFNALHAEGEVFLSEAA